MDSEQQTIPDAELVRQSQTGSLTAFDELVRRYEERIYRFVANVCRNRTDAREVTQDTFVRAYQAIARFDSRHSFAAWLFTIARRKCIDCYRAKLPAGAESIPEPVDFDDAGELLARREERQNLWQLAVRSLPTAQFQALWLRYAEGMNISEISQVQRKTQTHVKVLLYRARRALGHELNDGRESRPGTARPATNTTTAQVAALTVRAAAPLKQTHLSPPCSL